MISSVQVFTQNQFAASSSTGSQFFHQLPAPFLGLLCSKACWVIIVQSASRRKMMSWFLTFGDSIWSGVAILAAALEQLASFFFLRLFIDQPARRYWKTNRPEAHRQVARSRSLRHETLPQTLFAQVLLLLFLFFPTGSGGSIFS